MKKTLTKMIAASLAAVMLLTPMSANAIYQTVDGDSGDISRLTEGYTLVEDVTFFEWSLPGHKVPSDGYYVYVNDDGNKFLTFLQIGGLEIDIQLADGADKETIESALFERFGEDYTKVQFYLEPNYHTGTSYYLKRAIAMEIPTMKEAVEWLDFLKEQKLITSGRLITNRYQVISMFSENNKGVNQYTADIDSDLYERFSEFAESQLDGFHTEITRTGKTTYHVELVPPDGATLAEQIEAAQKVYEALGLAPNYLSPAANSSTGGGSIDVFNAVKGDANCDGRATVADSVAILQSIANADKYALSLQGRFNGDINGDYDGITAADARALQEWDAGLARADFEELLSMSEEGFMAYCTSRGLPYSAPESVKADMRNSVCTSVLMRLDNYAKEGVEDVTRSRDPGAFDTSNTKDYYIGKMIADLGFPEEYYDVSSEQNKRDIRLIVYHDDTDEYIKAALIPIIIKGTDDPDREVRLSQLIRAWSAMNEDVIGCHIEYLGA